jgi:hypothetical protein
LSHQSSVHMTTALVFRVVNHVEVAIEQVMKFGEEGYIVCIIRRLVNRG